MGDAIVPKPELQDQVDPLPIQPLAVGHHKFEQGAYKGKCIGVLTSGGDAPGMNAAVRAVVRLDFLIVDCRCLSKLTI